MRQRLAAVTGGAAWARVPGRRSTSAMQPAFSAANCRRRLAVRSMRSTSPTTAPRTAERRPSSMAASRSLSLPASATIRRSAARPTPAKPGPYNSRPRAHHRTGAARRPAMDAVNAVAAAKLPALASAPAISCSAPRGSPPAGQGESSASSPNGSTAGPFPVRKPPARSRPRRVSRKCRRASAVRRDISYVSRFSHGFVLVLFSQTQESMRESVILYLIVFM